MATNCLDNLLRVKRLSLRTVGFFRYVTRDNRTGVVEVCRWHGTSLMAMDASAQNWRTRHLDYDVWIEVQMGDSVTGESDIWTVEVERDA